MKPMMFYSMSMIFLALLTLGSAFIISRFIGGNQKKNFWLVLRINILAFISLFGYVIAVYNYTLAEILVRFSVIYFVFIAVATILSAVCLLLNYGYNLAKGNAAPRDPSRRAMLRKLVFVPAAGVGIYGGLYESAAIEYNEFTINTKNEKLKTVVMAQVSDVHLGLFFSVSRLEQVLNNCLQRGANLLVLTGDIFDSNILNAEAIRAVDKFVPLFPYGVYFCWGNHEHMRDMNLIRRELAKTRIKVLTNEAVKLFSAPDSVYILGVDYVESKDEHSSRREQFMAKAMAQVPKDSYKILLAHHPYFIDDGFRHKVDLTLTGHTHGGQVMIFNHPVLPVFKYMAGFVKKDNMIGFVSRGTGSWFPYRLGCPPEVDIFKFQ